MGTILSFISVKGGVGKTTVALETASSLANDFHKKVLLVDANFSAPNIGLYLDLTNEMSLQDVLLGDGLHTAIYESHGFDIVPASLIYNQEIDAFKLKKVLWKVKNRYDFIIIDSSPNYKELIPVIAASEKVFVVTTPDNVTLATSLKAAIAAKESNTPIEGLVVNRIRNPRYELDLKEIENKSGIPVVARIKDHKKMVESSYYKKPIGVYDNLNAISKEIKNFASALCGEPEKQGILLKIFGLKNAFGKEVVNRELLRKSFYVPQF